MASIRQFYAKSRCGATWSRLLRLLPAVVLLAGCSTPGKGLNVFAPYRGAQNGEEYHSPPANDQRYTQAPSYPAQLLKPVVKIKDEDTGTGLRRAPIGSSGMMPMGAQGPGY